MVEAKDLLVRRLRVSHVAAMAHDRLRYIGDMDSFSRMLLQPDFVVGLDDVVDLPFPADQPVGGDANWQFWSHIAETSRLRQPQTPDEARKLARAGIPLRYAAPVALDYEPPGGTLENARSKSLREGLGRVNLEVHLLPFGLAAVATADIVQPVPTALDQTMDDLDTISAWPFAIQVGGLKARTDMSSLATLGLELAEQVMADSRGASWNIPTHRVVTVIDANNATWSEDIPLREGLYHRAIHRLADGGPNLADPLAAFVPRWTNASFSWSSAEWVYMLDRGSSILMRTAQRRAGLANSTSFRHRRMCLLIAHISVSGALVKGASESLSPYFSSWGKIAAQRLGRLYGPSTPGEDFWGLEARQLIRITGLAQPIAALTGQPLTEKFPAPTTYP